MRECIQMRAKDGQQVLENLFTYGEKARRHFERRQVEVSQSGIFEDKLHVNGG